MKSASDWAEELYFAPVHRTYNEWYKVITQIQEDAFLAGVRHEREELREVAETTLATSGPDTTGIWTQITKLFQDLASRPLPPGLPRD